MYASVDNAVTVIQQLGQGTRLVKMDLKDAYRVIPVHPDDHLLLGICWDNQVFVDRSLPFGLRSAPKIFTAFADMVAWVIHCQGVRWLLHYLDDFLLFGAPGSLEIEHAIAVASRVFSSAGIPVATHKTEGPATAVTFLGILVDTVKFQLRLPPEKIDRLRALVQSWHRKQSCTRKELESFVGHLAHAATVIRPGRIFLRQLFSLMSRVSKPHHFIRLNASVRADLQWWSHFLQLWNGSSFFPHPMPSTHVYSDASGLYGCGAFECWFKVQWPSQWTDVAIAQKELVPVVIAAAVWGCQWRGSHVCFHSDNVAVVSVVNKRSAKDEVLNHLLRTLFFYGAFYQFHFSAEHVPGVLNTAADALSRNNVTIFSRLFPQVPQTHIPEPVADLLLRAFPDWGSVHWTSLFKLSLPRV